MTRRIVVRLPAAVSAAVLLAACADDPAAARITAPAGPSRGVAKVAPAAGRYLVGFDEATTGLPSAVLAASGGRIVDAIPGQFVLVVDGVTNPSALLQAGAAYVEPEFETTADPIVEAVDADATAAFVPTDVDVSAAAADPGAAAFYASNVQWDVKAMHADEAWPITSKGAGVNVCIVDSGVDDQHQELNGGKVLARRNFVTSPATEALPDSVFDVNGHGSHVAGEAAGRGVVTAGIAPAANILAARVLNRAGSGSETAIVNGIRWCADNGAHVINISIGGIRYRGQSAFVSSPITYSNAVAYARGKGAVVIVAAGNSNLQLPNPGSAQMTVPAEVAGVITVGATGPTSKIPQAAVPNWNPFDGTQVWQGPDSKAFYSNWGTGVSVFAPGGRGTVPLSAPFLFVGGQVQGSALDQIYGVCASTAVQTGQTNSGGVPTGSGACLGTTNRYIPYSGTSMAAPHVSGMAAVLYGEIGGAASPASAARVEACIRQTTDDIGPASIYGGGRVNLKKAVDALHAGSC